MHLHPVEFTLDLPLVDPVTLHLRDVPTPVTMERSDQGWRVALELPPGIYRYRFSVDDSLFLNDHRRSTQQPDGDELWSVLKVDPDQGPMWLERPRPTIKEIQVCRGVSDTFVPLMALEKTRLSDMPITLWLSIENLFSNAFLHVFLLRPDGALAFGAEYVLDHEWADAEYNARFHIGVQIEPEGFLAGDWSFVVRLEGGQTMTKVLGVHR